MIKLDSKAKNICVYLIPLSAALIARSILFSSWLESPFRYYHRISGLDMKTILGFAESFSQGKEEFSIYNLFVTACLKIGGDVPTIIACQCILGILTSLLITYITLRTFRNRMTASISGTIAALYGPELLYESVTLRESVFVFVATFSLAAILRQKSSISSVLWLVVSGCTLAAVPLVRLAGILWTAFAMLWMLRANVKYKTGNGLTYQRSLLLLPAAAFMVFMSVSLYNYLTVSNINPIPRFSSTPYVLKAGASASISAHPEPAQVSKAIGAPSLSGKFENYAGKLIAVFKSYEIPDNLNYYFAREFLKPMKHMPGPLFLIPLASLGILILACRRMFKGNAFLLLVYLFSFTVPLIVFMPLGRHRLVLLPVLCAFAGYSIVFILNCLMHFRKKHVMALVLAAAYSALFIFASPGTLPLRAEDFVAYGNAMEISGKYDKKEISGAYRLAHEINPYSISAAIYLVNYLMKNSEFAEAEAILKDLYVSNPGNQAVSINYASSLLGSGNAEKAEKILMGLPEPESRPSKVNYYYQLGESRRMQGRKPDAMICYKLALHYSDTDAQRQTINKAVDNIR
ncbi:MAG TPA: hypothetical protein DET40_11800 [Lentisphaeria bacterium]|nr:MAG: hypothetical protein A2X45_06055 [Lentisphaerae bacterium GWF2_50_93]HCE44222.1 hypothetical protein [Lentisphaeria bacterium]